MDLREAWKKLEEEKLSKPTEERVFIPGRSKHPVINLILSFKFGLGFIVFFEMIFVYLFFIMTQPIVKVSLGVVILLYLFLFIQNLVALTKMIRHSKLDKNTTETLQAIHDIVSGTLKFQRRMSWAFFPICIGAGFLLGISMNADAAAIIVKPVVIIILITTMVVATPLCYWASLWMIRISHGQYLEQIDELIRQTKEE